MTSQERQQFWRRHIGAWQASDSSGAAFCKPAGFARVTQLATGSVQDGLALHLPSGMRLSGITVDNLDVAVAILRQL